MPVELNELEAKLCQLENDIEELNISDASEKLLTLTKSIEYIFGEPVAFNDAQLEKLQDINTRLSSMCLKLSEAKESSKQELSSILKNKKKVGIYNQLK